MALKTFSPRAPLYRIISVHKLINRRSQVSAARDASVLGLGEAGAVQRCYREMTGTCGRGKCLSGRSDYRRSDADCAQYSWLGFHHRHIQHSCAFRSFLYRLLPHPSPVWHCFTRPHTWLDTACPAYSLCPAFSSHSLSPPCSFIHLSSRSVVGRDTSVPLILSRGRPGNTNLCVCFTSQYKFPSQASQAVRHPRPTSSATEVVPLHHPAYLFSCEASHTCPKPRADQEGLHNDGRSWRTARSSSRCRPAFRAGQPASTATRLLLRQRDPAPSPAQQASPAPRAHASEYHQLGCGRLGAEL